MCCVNVLCLMLCVLVLCYVWFVVVICVCFFLSECVCRVCPWFVKCPVPCCVSCVLVYASVVVAKFGLIIVFVCAS